MIKRIATDLTTRIQSDFELSRDQIKEYIEGEFYDFEYYEVLEEDSHNGVFYYVIEVNFRN